MSTSNMKQAQFTVIFPIPIRARIGNVFVYSAKNRKPQLGRYSLEHEHKEEHHLFENFKEFQSYGYTDIEIRRLQLAGVLEDYLAALRYWALRRTDREWEQWKLDQKFPRGSHYWKGRRVHFCRFCGDPIVFLYLPRERVVGGKEKCIH